MAYFYDIECTANYFSVVFERLEPIQDDEFVSTFEVFADTNDLYALIVFLNNVNTDILISYNGSDYDDLFLQWIRLNYRRLTDPIKANNELKRVNDMLIHSDYHFDFNKKLRNSLYRNPLPFTSLDLQKLHRLDYMRVSLKKVMVALKIDNILEFHPTEANKSNIKEIKTKLKYYTSEKLALVAMQTHSDRAMISKYNSLSNFEKFVLDCDLPHIRVYNHSDVNALRVFYEKSKDELRLRIGMANNFGIPINEVLSLSRSAAAEKLLIKFYKDISGLKEKDFTNTYTITDLFKLGDIIDKSIEFKSATLKKLKYKLDETMVDESTKIDETIIFDGTSYTIKSGGLHSKDSPGIFKSTASIVIQDADVTSYYPRIIINNKVCPRHLEADYFINMLENVITKRVEAKNKYKTLLKQGEHNEELYVTNNGLKIVINAIFGKLGQVEQWLYDLQALLKVTINGQLYLLSLIEMLHYEGIHTISANTDGIVCSISRNKLIDYNRVCKEWEDKYGFNLEYTPYDIYARRDVTNYITIIDKTKGDTTGNIKTKGIFTPKIDFTKGYKHPIVAKAVYEYIVNNTPIETTIRDCDDILDFCISVNSSSVFEMISYDPYNDMKKEKHQKTNRYFASTKGVILYKEYIEPKTVRLASGKFIIKDKIAVFKNSSVEIINNVTDRNPKNYKVNYPVYIREARIIIRQMEVLQQSLNLF